MTDTGKTTQQVLKERGSRYGSFRTQAERTMELMAVFEQAAWWPAAPPYIKKGITAICDKLSRIANGDPTYDDNWRDISGYATLVLNELEEDQKKPGFLARFFGEKVPPPPPMIVEPYPVGGEATQAGSGPNPATTFPSGNTPVAQSTQPPGAIVTPHPEKGGGGLG